MDSRPQSDADPGPPRGLPNWASLARSRTVPSGSRQVLLLVVTVLVIVLLVWFYDGVNVTAISDGWRTRYYSQAGRGDFWAELGESIQDRGLMLRFFRKVPYDLGEELAPDSFVASQYVLLATNLLRGVLAFLLLRELLPGHERFNYLATVLFVFYPADLSYFWLGANGLHFVAVVSMTAALCFTLAATRRSVVAGIAALFFLTVSLWGYPGFVLQLAAFPVLLFFVRRTARPFVLAVSIPWYLLVAINMRQTRAEYGGSYEASIADVAPAPVLDGYVHAFERLFITGWKDGIIGLGDLKTLVAALAAGLLSSFVFWSYPPRSAGTKRLGRQLVAVLIGSGLAAIILSYFPYSLTAHRFNYLRTLVMAGLGAAMIVAALVVAASQTQRAARFATVLVGVLVSVSVSYGIDLRHDFVEKSFHQQQLLAQVVDEVPGITRQNVLIAFVYDRQSSASQIRGLYNDPTTPLRLIYEIDVSAISFPALNPATKVTSVGIELKNKPYLWTVSPYNFEYSDLIVLRVNTDLEVAIVDSLDSLELFTGLDTRAYAPHALIDPAVDPTSPTCRMFSDGFKPALCRA